MKLKEAITFLSVITRTIPGREALLERCQESVSAQGDEVEHVLILDSERRGVAEAQKLLWSVEPLGDYVLVLDDDDYLAGTNVARAIQDALFDVLWPPFAVVKVEHGRFGTMPRRWGKTPACGEITVSNVIVRNDIWRKHRTDFSVRYSGDYDFIESLFKSYAPVWVDVVAVTVETMHNGALV